MTPANKPKQSAMPSRRRRSLGQVSPWEKVRTFAWVVFITVLVWVWADLEQTTTESLTVTVKVVAPSQSEIRVAQPSAEGVKIRFTCRGGQGLINEFLRQLREDEDRGVDTACIIRADPTWEPGPRPLDVVKLLNNWDRLRNAGLTAEEPDAERIDVILDRWETVTATVRLRTNDDNALDLAEMPAPPKVDIRVPQSRYNDIKDSLLVDTKQINLDDLPVNELVSRPVTLIGHIDQVPIEFVGSPEPPTVDVLLYIEERTATQEKGPIPVQLVASPELLDKIARGKYTLSRDDSRREDEWRIQVKITGPAKAVNRATAKDFRAFVVINEVDLDQVETYPERRVTIIPPPGVTIHESTKPVVHYKFESSNGETPGP